MLNSNFCSAVFFLIDNYLVQICVFFYNNNIILLRGWKKKNTLPAYMLQVWIV